MKSRKLIIWLISLSAAFGAIFKINSLAIIFNGYIAKDICSCIYLSGRSQESIEENDLNKYYLRLSTNNWDKEERSVTSTFFGFSAQTAIYREGLGCTLVHGANLGDARKLTYKPKFPAYNPDTVYWPTGNKLRDTIPPAIDIEKINIAISQALNEGHTRGIVVVYDTIFLAEAYNHGFDKDTRTLGWSMAKSIMNALVGILVKQGKLNLEGETSISEWSNDVRKNISLKNLLQMSSGLEWEEKYGKTSDVTKMLFTEPDAAKYAIASQFSHPPDSVWRYASGTSNIISEIIKRATGNYDDYISFPRNELFNKIGMRSMVLETDQSGTFVGSSYAFATPRDWARFGLLYLKNGYWGKEQILPDNWVKFTQTPARKSNGRYGAQFWLNGGANPKLPNSPSSIYFCSGYNGQKVYIVPSHNLVIVRMGISAKGEFDFDNFVASIIKGVEPQ